MTFPPPNPTPRDARLHGRFLYLDGLRGVAAMCVALFHFTHPYYASDFARQFDASMPGVVRHNVHWLEYGVEVFFVLSGFVIAHSLWGQRITLRFAGNFAVRRSLRLDPPYWVMILFCMFWPFLVFPTKLDGFFARFDGWRGIVVNALYLPDIIWWRDALAWLAARLSLSPALRDALPIVWHDRIVGVAWTLCLEVQFYLAYLVLIAIAQRLLPRRGGRAIVVAIFAALALYSMQRWFGNVHAKRIDDFGSRWWMFFAGALLYATIARAVRRECMIALLATLIFACLYAREPRTTSVTLTTLSIYLAATTGGLQTWLGWRWLQHLGRLSYSFYLVHLPLGVGAIVTIAKFGDGSTITAYAAVGLALVASLLGAELLNRAIEAPAMGLSNRLKPKKVARAEAAMAIEITAEDGGAQTRSSAASSGQSADSTPANRTSAARPES